MIYPRWYLNTRFEYKKTKKHTKKDILVKPFYREIENWRSRWVLRNIYVTEVLGDGPQTNVWYLHSLVLPCVCYYVKHHCASTSFFVHVNMSDSKNLSEEMWEENSIDSGGFSEISSPESYFRSKLTPKRINSEQSIPLFISFILNLPVHV